MAQSWPSDRPSDKRNPNSSGPSRDQLQETMRLLLRWFQRLARLKSSERWQDSCSLARSIMMRRAVVSESGWGRLIPNVCLELEGTPEGVVYQILHRPPAAGRVLVIQLWLRICAFQVGMDMRESEANIESGTSCATGHQSEDGEAVQGSRGVVHPASKTGSAGVQMDQDGRAPRRRNGRRGLLFPAVRVVVLAPSSPSSRACCSCLAPCRSFSTSRASFLRPSLDASLASPLLMCGPELPSRPRLSYAVMIMGDIVERAPNIAVAERRSLCFSQPMPGMVIHSGEAGFTETLLQHYSPAESNAAEELVSLKDTLRKADSERFWHLLTEGLANIADAQYAFVSKRILRDDRTVAVEMPPIGEPGACLMGAAFYINDGHGINTHMSNFKYHAYQCPCAYMKHDKIFIIPEKLNDFIVNNPNELAVPGEAYLGIPLFAEGKCFAHFGVMWSPEGAARRQLGWGYLEMLFHGLEDLILEHVLRGDEFATLAEQIDTQHRPKVVPHEAISMAQSLKPYARSLSHELRTPMQGVVGMLDVMMANVKEAAEDTHHHPRIRNLLESLRANIETVQDSSRRAVEAADNVVHAYDMNMGMPETPLTPLGQTTPSYNDLIREVQSEIPVTGNTLPLDQYRGTKRKAADVATWSKKVRVSRPARQRVRNSLSEEPPHRKSISALLGQSTDIDTMDMTCSHGASSAPCDHDSTTSPIFASEHSTVPGLRHTSLRDVVQYVINDALKVGGRPESAIAEETELGEKIVVHTRSSNGQATVKQIDWSVSSDIPDTILIDEKDLAKMISCVTLNAIKFTENGAITLKAALSPKSRYIVISVKDSGSGIPSAFLPNLFKPFSREDDSTTRQSEGLGLGLMVAKGLARKLGGDLFCLRSHVSGPDKGTEFEMRVPLTPGDICSRPATPLGSPSPSLKSRVSVDPEPLHMAQHPTTPPLSTEHKSLDSPAMAKIAPTLNHLGLPSPRSISPARGRATSKNRSFPNNSYDKKLARRYPANILIVDDNRINRQVLRAMLKNLGYTNIHEAYDGNDAVQQMVQNSYGPAHQVINLVLMDLWMPLLDGFQATEQILGTQSPAEKPIILAVSADVTDAAVERAGRVGMKGFLTKPFVIRDVERLILRHCYAIV
ncbi:hypothetical protein P280DRAFT_476178 [Massarina eburnea CBS 473.64]|uniref:histidine kinase n=1 Tax=Massarina eburnea CBS 473.64 TaxID=1395130 RepID=A0A6A6SCT0_9PLEO|nr:hypothetical protein P280DRAFT_476178 [Massarina eburnea CBS 473.64]